MAHYAFLNENNIVTEVIVGKDETDTTHNWEEFYGNLRGQTCKRTSYNENYRKNYAALGDTFDAGRDAFYRPQPYPSWVLNETTCVWEPPLAKPSDASFSKHYAWNEDTTSWIEVTYG